MKSSTFILATLHHYGVAIIIAYVMHVPQTDHMCMLNKGKNAMPLVVTMTVWR